MEGEVGTQQDIITHICKKKTIETMQDQGITDTGQLFLTDHVPSVLGRITDSDYRKTLWGGK